MEIAGREGAMHESFEQEVERRRPERENQPKRCSHCQYETPDLVNYSRHYGGNVGGHWLCRFCRHTTSANMLGAGGQPDRVTQDVAAMLNVLHDLTSGEEPEA